MRHAPIILKLHLFLEGSFAGNIVINTIVKPFKNATCAYYSQISLPGVHKLVSPSGLLEDCKLVSRRSLSSRRNMLPESGLGITP
jgi:hypothetical protein